MSWRFGPARDADDGIERSLPGSGSGREGI